MFDPLESASVPGRMRVMSACATWSRRALEGARHLFCPSVPAVASDALAVAPLSVNLRLYSGIFRCH